VLFLKAAGLGGPFSKGGFFLKVLPAGKIGGPVDKSALAARQRRQFFRKGVRMAGGKRGRAPTADELQQIAALRRAVAADVKEGRVYSAAAERLAKLERIEAQRRAFRRLLESAPEPQRRLAD
jgi:hypothetical protein